MNTKIESPQEQPLSSDQQKLERKALDLLILRLEPIQEKIAPQLQAPHLRSLFSHERIHELLTKAGAQEGDALPDIISKLRQAVEDMDRHARTVLPEVPEVAGTEESSEEQAVSEEQKKIQEDINELYRLNNEVEDEQDRLKEELVFLELFANEKKEEPDDVMATEMRIAQYEGEIAKLAPAPGPKRGLLQRMFQKEISQENIGGAVTPEEELKNKIMRAREGLEDRKRRALEQEERLRARLQEMRQVLGEPLAKEELQISWEELVQKIKDAAQKLHEKLDADFEKRKQEIAVLEQKRG